MSRKTLIQEHEKLMQRYNRAEGQRERNYKGYEKGVYLREYGLTQDVLSIDDTDTTKQIREKNEQLKEMFTGTQKMIVIPGATKQNRFIPLKRWQDADRIQSQQNYENYKLQMAGVNAVDVVRKKNEKGEYYYQKGGYNVVQGEGLDVPQLAGLQNPRIFFIKGVDKRIGARVPNRLSQGERVRYEEWLMNMAQVSVTEIKSSKTTSNYSRLFKGVPFKLNKKQRIGQYQKSIIKALTGQNSVMQVVHGDEELEMLTGYRTNKRKLNKVVKQIKSLTPKQLLYLSFKNSDIFTFDYLYSPDDYESRLDTISSTIESFNNMLKDKTSVEYIQYQKYLQELGSFYD